MKWNTQLFELEQEKPNNNFETQPTLKLGNKEFVGVLKKDNNHES